MRGYETLTVAYFCALVLAALLLPSRRRLLVVVRALVMAIGVGIVAFQATEAVRDWAPHAYLVVAYWLPALLTDTRVHPTRFERWLQKTDTTLRRGDITLPLLLQHLTELAYLLCYPLVPASFAIVWTQGSARDVNLFWLAVLAAGFACYASLPWLVSRPPRLVAQDAISPHQIAAANVFVLGRVSHELNTFPSGHVAVSFASAACVASVSPAAGALVAVTATAIAVGAVAGRYHYVIDVLIGVLVGAAAAALVLT